MARILSGLASMPRCDTRNPRSLPDTTPKTHLSGHDVDLAEVLEGLLEVVDERALFAGLDDDVVNVGVGIPPHQIFESYLYGDDPFWPWHLQLEVCVMWHGRSEERRVGKECRL